MRLVSVLEPSVVHATTEQWLDEDFARDFERRWLEVVDGLTAAHECDCGHTAIASAGFLSLMFDSRTQPAWMADSGARQRFIPLLYQRLWPMLSQIDVPCAQAVSALPAVDERAEDDPWLTSALSAAAWATERADTTVLHLGIDAALIDATVVSIGGGASAIVACCSDRISFLRRLPLTELAGRATMPQLPKLVGLACELFLSANPGRQIRYASEFSPAFAAMLVNAPADVKTRAIAAVVSRVTLTQKEAQADKGLKDEPLHDRMGRRRMRVTKDWRIHYAYVDGPGIRFDTLGPHDLGL